MCSNRRRRHVVSEGPLRGPDGTSVASDAATDDEERVLWNGGGIGSDGAMLVGIRGKERSNLL